MNISCEELKSAYEKALKEDFYENQEKVEFVELSQAIRSRGFLEPTELFYIICWKAPTRAIAKAVDLGFKAVSKHGANEIKDITEKAFGLARKGRVKEAIEKLDELEGVDVRVASAILTFYNPQEFGVIDRYAWLALYCKEKRDFTADDYVEYLGHIRSLAQKCNMTPRQVDLALWKLGIAKKKSR